MIIWESYGATSKTLMLLENPELRAMGAKSYSVSYLLFLLKQAPFMCVKRKLVTMLKVKVQVFEEQLSVSWLRQVKKQQQKKEFLSRKQKQVQKIQVNKEKKNQSECLEGGEGRTMTTRTSSSRRLSLCFFVLKEGA